MSETNKPSATFWTVVVCACALILYPLFGPACWLNQRSGVGTRAILIAYRPIIWIGANAGLAETIARYAALGVDENVRPVFLDSDILWVEPEIWELIRSIKRLSQPSIGEPPLDFFESDLYESVMKGTPGEERE